MTAKCAVVGRFLTGVGWWIVCRTCSDYNHECLGYSDQPPSARPQPEVALRAPTMRTFPDPGEPAASRTNTQVESGPSDSPPRNAPPPPIASVEKSFEAAKLPEVQTGSVSRDMSRTTKESEQQTTGETPESSMCPVGSYIGRRQIIQTLTTAWLNRSHVSQLRCSHPRTLLSIFRTHGYCSRV